MTSSRRPLTVLTRAAAVLAGIAGAATATGVVTWHSVHDLGADVARTESALVALAGTAALVVLARIALLVVSVAAPAVVAGARGRDLPPAPRRAGLERLVAGLVLGAAALSPQAAGAAPAGPAAVTRVVGADAGPVDPTYLGPSPAAPAAADTPATGATPARPRVDAAREGARPATTTTPAATVAVERGDTLWGIAHDRLVATGHGAPDDAQVARAVLALYAANRDAVGHDPDLIVPGTRLVVPDLVDVAAPAATTTATTTAPTAPEGPR